MDVDQSSGYGDILLHAEQLTADIDGPTELPRVQRNLRQILEAGHQIWTRSGQTSSDNSGVNASILLGRKGYDLPSIAHKLDTISSAKPFEPLEPVNETDIQGYLKNQRENAILSVIEESKKSTFERANKLYWQSLRNEWENEKRKILDTLTGQAQQIPDITSYSSFETSRIDQIDRKIRSAMDSVEIAYSKELYLYNERVISGTSKYNLTQKFLTVAKEQLEDKSAIDLWELVCTMTDIPVFHGQDILALRCSHQMQSALLGQARKYLESKYLEFVRSVVKGNLQDARLGGVPSTYNLVHSYLNVQLPASNPGLEDGEVEGQPVWAFIYYCIRCGDIPAALRVAKSTGPLLADFANYLQEYMSKEERRLNPSNESQIRLYYRRVVAASTDPFKRIVYCILGCCDVTEDHTKVADKLEDYLWLRLCQVPISPDSESGEEINVGQSDRITLSKLQTLLLDEYGESHFNAYQQPFLYFRVLFLTAQFEAALVFLFGIEHLRTHAVHVAIALYEQGLLALPQSPHEKLLSKQSNDRPPMQRLNFARMIMLYVRKFETTDPREALQYFYLLRSLKGANGDSLFMSCISQLALETKEYEMLLGSMQEDNCRMPGIIDKFGGDTFKIIEVVAVDTEEKGLYEDAIRLYDLGKNYGKVVELLNKLLSQVVSQVSSPGSARDRLENLAMEIAKRYRAHGCGSNLNNKDLFGTFYLLLDIVTFFNYYHSRQLMEALDTIKMLKLIPFESSDVEPRVNAFSMYTEEIRRNVPDILLSTMNILYTQYKNARSSPVTTNVRNSNNLLFDDTAHGHDQYIAYLRKQARALIMFAGMIPYRMPGDTNARLVQLEVLMN